MFSSILLAVVVCAFGAPSLGVPRNNGCPPCPCAKPDPVPTGYGNTPPGPDYPRPLGSGRQGKPDSVTRPKTKGVDEKHGQAGYGFDRQEISGYGSQTVNGYGRQSVPGQGRPLGYGQLGKQAIGGKGRQTGGGRRGQGVNGQGSFNGQGFGGQGSQGGRGQQAPPNPPDAVAFFGTRSSSQFFFQPVPVIFDNVITNIGGSYDARYGVFTAFESGIYLVKYHVVSQRNSTKDAEVDLLRNNEVINSASGRGPSGETSNSAVVFLNRFDQLSVQGRAESAIFCGEGGDALCSFSVVLLKLGSFNPVDPSRPVPGW